MDGRDYKGGLVACFLRLVVVVGYDGGGFVDVHSLAEAAVTNKVLPQGDHLVPEEESLLLREELDPPQLSWSS